MARVPGVLRGAEAGVLVAGTSNADGLVWDPSSRLFVPGALVRSVNGRTGAVVIEAGDVTSDQVTNLSNVTGDNVTQALDALDGGLTDVVEALGELPSPNPAGRIQRSNGTHWVSYPGETAGHVLGWDGTQWVSRSIGSSQIAPFTTARSPVGLWNFDRTTNAVVGPNLSPNGAVNYADIVPGKTGLYLTGGLTLSAAAPSPELHLQGEVSVLAIMQCDDHPVTGTVVSYAGSSTTEANNTQWAMFLQGSTLKLLQAFWSSGAGVQTIFGLTAPNSLPPIHNVIMIGFRRVIDGASRRVQMFVNGRPTGPVSGLMTAPTGGSLSVVRVGRSTQGTLASCMIYGIKVFPYALTDDEFRTEYNETLGQGFGTI